MAQLDAIHSARVKFRIHDAVLTLEVIIIQIFNSRDLFRPGKDLICDQNILMQLSDRIKVIYNGELFDGGKYKEKTDKEIGLLMLGEHGNDSK